MQIEFKNEKTGLSKNCPTGFSWTTLFFGFFVPIVRGWYLYAAVFFALAMITAGLSMIVYPFIINKHYATYLIEHGYTPVSDDGVQRTQEMGVAFSPVGSA